jgi:multiple sugar transport system permease protein
MSTDTNLLGLFGDEDDINWRRRATLKRYGLYVAMVFIALFYFAPIYWVVKSSVQPLSVLFSQGSLSAIPNQVTWRNFRELIFNTPFPTWYMNSLLVAGGVVVLTLVVSVLAGYTLTRLDVRGKSTIANVTVISYMYPPLLLVIPMFLLWFTVGLTNTRLGLILAQSALTIPFCIWLMWQFFQTVPIRLEESAWMQGASRFKAFRTIALPMSKPGLIAVAIFSFATSWNDFTMSNILMQEEGMRTLPVGVLFFTEQFNTDWGLILSATVLISIPPILLVYALQNYLLQGFRVTT